MRSANAFFRFERSRDISLARATLDVIDDRALILSLDDRNGKLSGPLS